MKKLFFKEVALEELNSHGTDFWTGVGIGAGVVAAGAGVAGVLIVT
ncbi:hypothetical protein [Bacillus cereus]|nr:hypothetical protein [Bacillus cereus]EJS62837.1 hypothetical protein ICU_04911 [Bacillus cereus BAG2X1-1]EJS65134.1 hypothetical protein ICY_05133 [Bacillus cereus BAG2X1-3]